MCSGIKSWVIIDMCVDPEKDMRVDTYRVQARHDIGTEDPLIVIAAPPCTVFSSMQNINQKHHGTPEWEKKYEDGLTLLQFFVDVWWDQISRGKFFLHEHPATVSSWDIPMIRDLTAHLGVSVVTGDMCRWETHLAEERKTQGTDQPVLVKKPTKWMTNCPSLAILLGVRCTGGHEHSKLEGSRRTLQASKSPTSLVQGILNLVRKLKTRLVDANHSRDPVHFMIPESLRQTEDEIALVCNRKQMSRFEVHPPLQVSWDQILVRRTIDRRTGVVIAEEVAHELPGRISRESFLDRFRKKFLLFSFIGMVIGFFLR